LLLQLHSVFGHYLQLHCTFSFIYIYTYIYVYMHIYKYMEL